jgi:hypothetical protein
VTGHRTPKALSPDLGESFTFLVLASANLGIDAPLNRRWLEY